ncbi:MAG: histidine phosphatase family protein [Lentisphaeria bacterium]|nr:histidine phosphatase family protein [Lentisphaeria bacterium]
MKKSFLFLLSVLGIFTLSARMVYITRHGQVGDKKYFEQSVKEIKLTPLGVFQSQALADHLLNKCRFNGNVYVSPLYRTIETGSIIADPLKKPVIIEPGLQEVARKATPPGMTKEQIEKFFPGKTIFPANFKENWRLSFEDNFARQLRVNAAVKRILREEKGDILLVSHGGVIGNLIKALFLQNSNNVKKISGTSWNCSLFAIELDENDNIVKASYTTEFLPDAKVTSNFRTPKIPRTDDPRYENLTVRQAGERLLIITRHCQQTGGIKGASCPIPGDAGISALGIKQSLDLGKELKRLNFKGKIYTSPYFRTVATGCYAASVCGSKVYPDARVQRRCHRSSGNLKNGGATLKQLRDLFPNEIAPDARLDNNWMIKRVETQDDQCERVKKALNEILAENPGEDILIVCHGTGVAAYYRNLTGKNPQHKVWNCAMFKFAVDKKGKIRYLGYDHSFMPDEEVTNNFKSSLLKKHDGESAR